MGHDPGLMSTLAWTLAIVMVWTQVLDRPQPSVAVQVRAMIRSTGSAGHVVVVTASPYVIVGDGWQASDAVAVPVADGSAEPPQVTVASAGQVMVGGVVSTIDTEASHAGVCP